MKLRCLTGGNCQSRWDRFGMNLFLGVMGAGVLLAAWLLMQQAARHQVVYEFSEAARSGDLQALNRYTDWVAVRTAMKQDMRERLAYGRDMAPETVDELVDQTVRPENLLDLVTFVNQSIGNTADPSRFVGDARFSGITEFTIEITLPPSTDAPLQMGGGQPIRAAFALDGMNWKLKRLDAPSTILANASLLKNRQQVAAP